ncbi:MAG: L-2-amino-thiazoline-4-carboxylic acid hydrolase [Anaerolineae bacterium]|jgi:hypothetical protein
MSVKDTFTGAKSGLTFLFAYQNIVAQDIGTERALALNNEMTKAMGTAQGKELKARIDVHEIPPKLAAALVGEFLKQALGIASQITEGNEEKATVQVGRCPIYEAAEALGMEHGAIEALCRAGAIPYMDAIVKQFNPDLAYDLSQFRPAVDASCVETIVVDGR